VIITETRIKKLALLQRQQNRAEMIRHSEQQNGFLSIRRTSMNIREQLLPNPSLGIKQAMASR